MIKAIQLILIFSCLYIKSLGQEKIEVGEDKTTYIVVKNKKIELAESGDKAVIGEVLSANGLVKLKAVKPFIETNLIIVLQDTIVEFVLHYKKSPNKTLYRLEFEKTVINKSKAQIEFFQQGDRVEGGSKMINLPSIEEITEPEETVKSEMEFTSVRNFPNFLTIDNYEYKIKMSLTKLVVNKDYIYFQLRCLNSGNLSFNIETVKIQIQQKKSLFKKSVSQNVYPNIYEDKKNVKELKSWKQSELVFAVKKITLRTDEMLIIYMYEKSEETKGRYLKIVLPASRFNNMIKQLK